MRIPSQRRALGAISPRLFAALLRLVFDLALLGIALFSLLLLALRFVVLPKIEDYRPEIVAHLDDPGWVLVDARTPEEYERGHIPGAVNINFLRNLSENGLPVWRPADDLRAMYAAAGVTPDKHVVPYCATGARSAVTDFTLRWLGYPSVALYSASWQEWNANPDTPKTQGSTP